MADVKIATCCYCGTRAALVLRGEGRHELSCSACGAPLSRMKMLRSAPGGTTAPAATPARPAPRQAPPRRQEKPKKRKKKKDLKHRLWAELWDAVEDILD